MLMRMRNFSPPRFCNWYGDVNPPGIYILNSSMHECVLLTLFTSCSLICEVEVCLMDLLRLGEPSGLAGGMDTGRDGFALGG